MSKGPLPFALVLIALCAMSCAPSQQKPVSPSRSADFDPPANDCSNGRPTDARALPVVCVEKVGGRLVITPDSITAWDASPTDKATANMIHWVTRGGGSLQIQFKDAGCVEPPECNSKGHCRAKTVDITGTKRCRYGVTLDGIVLDPETVIVDCC